MTREKAVEVLKRSQKIISPISPLYEAIGVALEQLDVGATDTDVGDEPISHSHENDTISRREATDALRKMQTYKLFSGDDMLLIDQAGAMTELMMLPPAEPKKGKWIYQNGMIKCDQCLRAIRRIDHDGLLNFCPNCGADMREVTE